MDRVDEAVRQLHTALSEQARLGDDYQRALGTPAEQSTYVRLQAATLQVSNRDRLVRSVRHPRRAQAQTP